MRRFALAGLVALLPSSAWGQAPTTPSLIVDAQVTSVSSSGDVVRVEYVVTNRPASGEALTAFTVEAPSPVLKIALPAPASRWIVLSRDRGRSVASWATLGEHIAPGESSPPLVFEARGLPTIVRAWAERDVPHPTTNEDGEEPDIPPPPPTSENA